jgi:uncharacterized protein YdcH (DUF465 family)
MDFGTSLKSNNLGDFMPLENHSLVNEFPEMRERIHALKTSDNHFARLFAEYDEAEHAVHRIESGAEASTDERLDTLKKQRLHLKDALVTLLKKAA